MLSHTLTGRLYLCLLRSFQRCLSPWKDKLPGNCINCKNTWSNLRKVQVEWLSVTRTYYAGWVFPGVSTQSISASALQGAHMKTQPVVWEAHKVPDVTQRGSRRAAVELILMGNLCKEPVFPSWWRCCPELTLDAAKGAFENENKKIKQERNTSSRYLTLFLSAPFSRLRTVNRHWHLFLLELKHNVFGG